jgi:hypothetical protein
MAQQQLMPFRAGTRQRLVLAGQGQYAFTIGTTNNVNVLLPNVGQLGMIILKVRGTITLSAAGAFGVFGPWTLVANATISTNLGSVPLWNATGYGSYLAQRWQKEGWDPSLAGVGSTTPDANVYVFPTAATGAYELTYILTLSLNDGLNFELGLLNNQSPQVQTYLNITLDPTLTDVVTTATANTGTIEAWYWYYDIGDPSQFALPPLTIVRTVEDMISPIAATGDNVQVFPQLGVMTNFTQYIRLNSVLSDLFSQTYMRVNKTDVPYVMERQVQKAWNRKYQMINPVVGAGDWNFFQAYGPINMGDFRDCWDTEAFAYLEAAVSIPTGTTLGAIADHRIIRRVVQLLQTTPAQPAAQ